MFQYTCHREWSRARINGRIFNDGKELAKIGRNQSCACGSGKKYEHFCWQHDQTVGEPARQPVSPAMPFDVSVTGTACPWWGEPDDDAVVDLSNSAICLVTKGRLDEADAVCEQLRIQFSAGFDRFMCKATACEAHRYFEHAIEYRERSIAWIDESPEFLDPESREPFCEDIEDLRGLPGTAG